MRDQYNREIDYLRISITDRCNFRCNYCMPDEPVQSSGIDILSFEEIIRVVKLAAKLGIKKIKITGGEPLVRQDCCDLIRTIKNVEGIDCVTLTTNGFLIDEYIDELIAAQVDAVNVSLDTFDPIVFQEMTSVDGWNRVYQNILLLTEKGIRTKINVVSMDTMINGISEIEEWNQFVELTRDHPLDVRFIELMPIGYGKNYSTINHTELFEKIKIKYPNIHADTAIHGNGPAVYYKIDGFQGSIGFISAMHGKFCDSCNRVRLTSTGFLKLCLCYQDGEDLRNYLRDGSSDDVLEAVIRKTVDRKPRAHRFEDPDAINEKRSMVEIGG